MSDKTNAEVLTKYNGNRSSAENTLANAKRDSAGALVKASLLMRQREETFRALLITPANSPDKAGARLLPRKTQRQLVIPWLELRHKKIEWSVHPVPMSIGHETNTQCTSLYTPGVR